MLAHRTQLNFARTSGALSFRTQVIITADVNQGDLEPGVQSQLPEAEAGGLLEPGRSRL